MKENLDFFELEDEDDSIAPPCDLSLYSQAVLHSSDWTVGTIIDQLERKNIEMNPRFQRRDAWSRTRKSLFIESLILNLPVPQIVLAEKKDQRGRYIVLDGKQRLLSLLQFTGKSETPNNNFGLSGLEIKKDLSRKKYKSLDENPELIDDLNSFLNYTIRTVVIKNWPNYDFLHTVFLRLNTGSVKLSPQELRQALFPGEYSNYIDDYAAKSSSLKALLGNKEPDARMRDVEIISRFLSFQLYLDSYHGRMKSFLDECCEKLNKNWPEIKDEIDKQISNFEDGISLLVDIFGSPSIARKSDSRSFNRAIFDALIYYTAKFQIREAMRKNPVKLKKAYEEIISDDQFLNSVESDTAGIPNTFKRLQLWGNKIQDALEIEVLIPTLVDNRIATR
ncbi:DUF262 domain-containing protein [Pseudomonas sp. MBLB4123]|uniref:DUF262 domain-containing protein n=1 Tax=Pseudomonas sp. MBLB4123 TaxID=3451557 RepID=UPI003F757056